MTERSIHITPAQAKTLAGMKTHVFVEETNLAPNVLAIRTAQAKDEIFLLDQRGQGVELTKSGIRTLPSPDRLDRIQQGKGGSHE